MDVGDQDPIVGHGHALVLSAGQTLLHLPLIEHTGPAVDDQLKGRQILLKAAAGGIGEHRLFSRIAPDPARQLDRADIIALAVMGAALADQDLAALLELI